MTIIHSRAHRNRRRGGFSLVEMIGVLAIIAILAVVIVPKVFSTIASSRVTSAIGSVTSMKAAITEFSGKYGTIPTTANTDRIDDLLVAAGMLDNRFTVKIGTQQSAASNAATWSYSGGAWTATGGSNQNTLSRIICQNSNTTAPNTAAGRNFQLDGATDLPSGSRVVAAVLVNIRGSEALELSQRLDGDVFSAADASTADAAGKVVYNTPNNQGLTTAYVYIVHQ